MNPLGSSNTNRAPVNVVLNNIAETINFAKSFQSPQAFMSELQKQNPQEAQRLAWLSRTLKNPMQAAVQALSEQGITPEQMRILLGQKR